MVSFTGINCIGYQSFEVGMRPPVGGLRGGRIHEAPHAGPLATASSEYKLGEIIDALMI